MIKDWFKNKSIIIKLYSQYRSWKNYSLKKKFYGFNNQININESSYFTNSKIKIVGNNNSVEIDENCLFNNFIIFIQGNNNKIKISNSVRFNKCGELWIEDNFGSIEIGNNTSIEETHIAVTEDNSKIFIGQNCLFANNIDIRTGDSHSIIDKHNNKRINQAKDVYIHDHVWIGAHSSILKGVTLYSDTIVATRSVVTKSYDKSGIILAGSPAKIVKENVTWKAERIK